MRDRIVLVVAAYIAAVGGFGIILWVMACQDRRDR